MNNFVKSVCVLLVSVLSGCAHLDFGDDKGLAYYDAKPYLFVSTTTECVTTATIIAMPESKREVKFKSGYGSADLSVNLSNGMITSVNQKTDTQIPATITSIAGLGTAAAGVLKSMAAAPAAPEKPVCKPTATLYPVDNGVPNINAPISFSVTVEPAKSGSSKDTHSDKGRSRTSSSNLD